MIQQTKNLVLNVIYIVIFILKKIPSITKLKCCFNILISLGHHAFLIFFSYCNLLIFCIFLKLLALKITPILFFFSLSLNNSTFVCFSSADSTLQDFFSLFLSYAISNFSICIPTSISCYHFLSFKLFFS